MPGKFAAAFEHGGGFARQGGQGHQNMLAMYAGFSLFVFGGLVAVETYSYVLHRNPENLAPFEYALIAGAMLLLFRRSSLAHELYWAAYPRQCRATAARQKVTRNLIRDGNEKGIDQYVRLSNLSGTTGAATKLGLTGLPLATASLTIFFSALAIFGINGFLDLTKLTLGAFIGSFVQRNLSDERLASGGDPPTRR